MTTMDHRTEAAIDATPALCRNERGQLVFRAAADAAPIEDVRIVRCLPWSDPGRYIAVRNKDGEEVHLYPSLDAIDDETRALIDQELGQQEFLPRIVGIDAVDDRHEVMTWSVRTDRGPIDLMIKDADDIRHFDDGRVLIRDHAGGVFQVADPDRLDARSRLLLDQYLA